MCWEVKIHWYTTQSLPPVSSQSSGAVVQTGTYRVLDAMQVGCALEHLGYLGTPVGIVEQEATELIPQGGVGVSQGKCTGREERVADHYIRGKSG